MGCKALINLALVGSCVLASYRSYSILTHTHTQTPYTQTESKRQILEGRGCGHPMPHILNPVGFQDILGMMQSALASSYAEATQLHHRSISRNVFWLSGCPTRDVCLQVVCYSTDKSKHNNKLQKGKHGLVITNITTTSRGSSKHGGRGEAKGPQGYVHDQRNDGSPLQMGWHRDRFENLHVDSWKTVGL